MSLTASLSGHSMNSLAILSLFVGHFVNFSSLVCFWKITGSFGNLVTGTQNGRFCIASTFPIATSDFVLEHSLSTEMSTCCTHVLYRQNYGRLRVWRSCPGWAERHTCRISSPLYAAPKWAMVSLSWDSEIDIVFSRWGSTGVRICSILLTFSSKNTFQRIARVFSMLKRSRREIRQCRCTTG